LAESILGAQAREIENMNAWRERWYGAPSPAGGVPADVHDAEAEDMHGGEGGHSDGAMDYEGMHGGEGMGH
jgi:uncharacterized protein (DUF305 family)